MNKEKEQKESKCMFQNDGIHCINSSYGGARGMCMTHYVNCRYNVKKGNTTWKELEEKGLCSKKLSQAEKNINQMHPHRSYNKKPKFDF